MATITKSLTIESQGTYNLTFNLWSYSEWAASAGITTSYASLAALIADEKAVRQLMTVHASVDYFANCPDSSIISTVINNDLCAKWINLRDYALDTLSAKSNIKSVMDTADKYGYGEWGKIDSTTWGALGNVPIMTSDSAPYGTARSSGAYSGSEAYKAFDGNLSTYFKSSTYDASSNFWVSYKAVNPIKPKKAYVQLFNTDGYAATTKFKIQGSNDGFASDIHDVSSEITCTVGASSVVRPYDPVEVDITADAYYMEYRIIRTYTSIDTRFNVVTFQLYGRELHNVVPYMTSNTTPYGTASSDGQHNSSTMAYRAFDGDNSTNATPGDGTSATPFYIMYEMPEEKYVKDILLYKGVSSSNSLAFTLTLQYYSNGEWHNVDTNISANYNTVTSKLYPVNTNLSKVRITGTRQKYTPAGSNVYTPCPINRLELMGPDYSEKEFAQGSTRKTIYDHGVELVSIARSGHNSSYSGYSTGYPEFAENGAYVGKNGDNIMYVFVTNATIETTSYNTLNMIADPFNPYGSGTDAAENGALGYTISKNPSGQRYFDAYQTTGLNKQYSYNISNVNGSNYLGFMTINASRKATIYELWLE